ncbi:MAG: SgcJ/EcaC family oxidoreductase [Acidobacteria bacterium]|nr:SgcJ/EcaC family oxidoreductase [Acidobacteriota bacterium]
MKLVCLFVLSLIAPVYMLAQAPNKKSADEANIRQIILEQESAWNAGNAKEYSSSFQEDGVFTIITGSVFYSRRALEERVAQIFATVFKNSKLSQKIKNIRFVRKDIAIVNIETEMTGYQALPPGVKASADGRLRTSMLQLMAKERGKWRIAAFHNVDVKTP